MRARHVKNWIATCSSEDQKYKMAEKENRCWPGYEPVKGKAPHTQGSCRPKAESKTSPAQKKVRAARRKQLDKWEAEHPNTRKSASQNLRAPKESGTKTTAKKAKSATAKRTASKASAKKKTGTKAASKRTASKRKRTGATARKRAPRKAA